MAHYESMGYFPWPRHHGILLRVVPLGSVPMSLYRLDLTSRAGPFSILDMDEDYLFPWQWPASALERTSIVAVEGWVVVDEIGKRHCLPMQRTPWREVV